MPSDCIPFRDTGYFSELICDYLDQKEELKPFYNRFPSVSGISEQIKEKSARFPATNREVLCEAILDQYEDTDASIKTRENILKLKELQTFTITTGHQLNLFTGPVYFIYKIISTINLCKELKVLYPDQDFVPIYWMASEDHDFDEINYFNFKGQKVQWSKDNKGAVGRFDTGGLDSVLEAFTAQLGVSTNAKELISLFDRAYNSGKSLSQAMHWLVNELFGEYGLVIVDGDHKDLKRLFIPYLKGEVQSRLSGSTIEKSSEALKKLKSAYKIQVNPREINLFYLEENVRERIVFENNRFKVRNSKIDWDEKALSEEIESNPERFSPNVVLRPLYQEVILPNLCYIGGGGELAYWLQLKENFDRVKIPFPMLLLRNSVLLFSNTQKEKAAKLDLEIGDLFLKQEALVQKMTKVYSEFPIDFSSQKDHLQNQFQELHKLAKLTDRSFEGAVSAQERKQIKGLEHLEKRLIKAQKKRLSEKLDRVKNLQNDLFPNASLQERQLNFSEIYLEKGEGFIAELIKQLDPLNGNFCLLEL